MNWKGIWTKIEHSWWGNLVLIGILVGTAVGILLIADHYPSKGNKARWAVDARLEEARRSERSIPEPPRLRLVTISTETDAKELFGARGAYAVSSSNPKVVQAQGDRIVPVSNGTAFVCGYPARLVEGVEKSGPCVHIVVELTLEDFLASEKEKEAGRTLLQWESRDETPCSASVVEEVPENDSAGTRPGDLKLRCEKSEGGVVVWTIRPSN